MAQATALGLALALGILASMGCVRVDNTVRGSGVSKTETRQVQPFTKISTGGSFDVNIAIGEPLSLTLTADDNLLPLITTDVSGDTLKVETTETVSTRTPMRLDIVMPRVAGVSVSGSGDVRIDGVKEPAIRLAIAGSGDITAVGSADEITATVSGSGSLRLADLAARTAAVNIAGSGDAIINAAEALKVSIAGSGDVEYIGSPRVEQRVAGSGSIRQRPGGPR